MNLSEKDFRVLELAFSANRLNKYRQMVGGNLASAIKLHHLDMLLAAELTIPLRVLELTLRNAIHAMLSDARQTEFWFNDPGFEWREPELKKVEYAGKRAGHYSRSGGLASDVVVQLYLGFWSRCFSKTYENDLWYPYLKRLFPDRRIERQHVDARLESLVRVRNRVAHHESIFPERATETISHVRFILSNIGRWQSRADEVPTMLKILEPSFALIEGHMKDIRVMISMRE
jgi:hypothetical protein